MDGWDSEELKNNADSFIIDTSDVSSSDGGYNNQKVKGSPSSNDSITTSDPY